MAQYSHLSTPDPEFAAALSQLGELGLTADLQELRRRAEVGAEKASFPESQLKVQDWKVPIDGGEIDARTYISPQGSNPLMVWAHGGGFISGGIFSDDAWLQKLAIDLGLSIVNVGYRLAPEHPFPAGLNDTYDTLKWAYHHADELSADITKGFILGGCSAGGTFTAVLTHKAREDPDLRGKITGQILHVPLVVHYDAIPEKYKEEILSLEQNKDAPIVSWGILKIFLDYYGCKDPAAPEVSPLRWASHSDLPPAYLQICGMDPLRDEGLLYEKLLKANGIKTKLDIYPGVPHIFEKFFPNIKQAAKLYEDRAQGIKWLLHDARAM